MAAIRNILASPGKFHRGFQHKVGETFGEGLFNAFAYGVVTTSPAPTQFEQFLWLRRAARPVRDIVVGQRGRDSDDCARCAAARS